MSILLFACGSQSPAPAPPATGSAPGRMVNANNRLGWDQSAADSAELATIRYAVYVDGVRSELTDVSCANTTTGGSFACTSHLPAMTPGSHVLELASFIEDGAVLESSKTPPLQITYTGIVAPAAQRPDVPLASTSVTSRGNRTATRLPLVADGLERISDLAFAPDGRLFIAERTGRIRVVRDGQLLAEPALDTRQPLSRVSSSARDEGQFPGSARDTATAADAGPAVLALAFDPQFDRTHFVYALSTATSRRGMLSFVVARYREAGDTLADRVVLLDDVAATSPEPAGALRFGPDGKLYVAFDAGGDARLPGDMASPNGKVLRLNPDGTTPDDQAGASPLYSAAYWSPRGLGWDRDTGLMWIVDAAGPGIAQLNAVGLTAINNRKRGVTKATMPLPQPGDPSALLVFGDSVLIASMQGQPLLRGRIDPNDTARILHVEPVLDTTDGLQALTIGPDGGLYVATARTVGRLSLQ